MVFCDNESGLLVISLNLIHCCQVLMIFWWWMAVIMYSDNVSLIQCCISFINIDDCCPSHSVTCSIHWLHWWMFSICINFDNISYHSDVSWYSAVGIISDVANHVYNLLSLLIVLFNNVIYYSLCVVIWPINVVINIINSLSVSNVCKCVFLCIFMKYSYSIMSLCIKWCWW